MTSERAASLLLPKGVRDVPLSLLDKTVLATLGMVFFQGACARPEPHSLNRAALPEPVLPAFPSASLKSSAPAWMATLPVVKPSVEVGRSAWATLVQAGGELAEVGLVRVEVVGASAVTVVDKTGQRLEDVPGALVHPLGDTRNLREGMLVLFYTWTTPGWIGRVARTENGADQQIQYDLAGVTTETPVDHAEPLRRGIGPLAFVAFTKSGLSSMGQVVALDERDAWLLTGSGHVEKHSRVSLDSLAQPAGELTVGQPVRAYRWATGFEQGAVVRVVEPGLRYEVAVAKNPRKLSYFIGDLVPL